MVSDSPQVQCIQSYTSQEPDELSTEMADVLNLLERTDDGMLLKNTPVVLKKLQTANKIFFTVIIFFHFDVNKSLLNYRLDDG